MNGVLIRILPAVLFLSTFLIPERSVFAQTTDRPVVTIVASDHHAAEAEQEIGAFTVSRTGNTEASLLVFYELSGTARNGADYQELPGTITIPAGAVSAPITIKPINDSLAEGTETIVATLVPSRTLSPIEPYRVGFPSSDVILLADNDSPDTVKPVVTIEATDPLASEIPEVPPGMGLPQRYDPAIFTVRRTGSTDAALEVRYRIEGTAVNGVDYTKLSGVVRIPPGSATGTIEANPIDDGAVEGTETIVVILLSNDCDSSPPTPGCYVIGSHPNAEAHILDNDEANALPAVKIVLPVAGAAFGVPAKINILAEVRDPDGWVGLVEFFANERKIGEQSVDFIREPDPGQLQSFFFEWREVPQGEYALVARATDDRGGKGASDPVRVRVGEPAPTIPVLTIIASDAFAREGTNSSGEMNTAIFLVRRTGEANTDLTVFLSIHGTAINGVDYESLPNTVTIPAGRQTARIVVRPIRDEQREPVETVLLVLEPDPSLGPVPHYTLGETSKAAAAIADGEQPAASEFRTADGLFHLSLPGENGAGFRLECSTELIHWIPLCTNVVTDGAIHFVDPDAEVHVQRFYRVVPESNVNMDN
jgi:hypothetical protein